MVFAADESPPETTETPLFTIPVALFPPLPFTTDTPKITDRISSNAINTAINLCSLIQRIKQTSISFCRSEHIF